MKPRKDFDECVNNNKLIETGDKDISMVKELLRLAEHRLEFWGIVKDKSNKYPSLFIEGHYEIIKELCTAILALEGWKALDHECLFAYLKSKKSGLEIDYDYLLELKDTRNSIDYRGIIVSHDIWKNNEINIKLTISALMGYLKSKVN